MGWKSRFFCDFVKFWPLGWKSGFFCDFVGFWPLKKCSICFLAPTLLDTVGFEVAPKGRPGGIRASDLQAPSPNCLVVHPLDLPKIPKSQNPKSQIPKIPKIQNPKSPKSPKIPQIQNPKSPKSKIQNPQNPKSPKIPKIQNPKSPKSQNPNWGFLDFGFWGFWILDFGPLCSKSLCEAPNAPNLGDFGFWILAILGVLDFGFWIRGILDFGFWGFWILDLGDFGFWILGILDFGFWGFWILDFADFGAFGEVQGCTTRQFGDGAWRSEARIPPGPPFRDSAKPTLSDIVGARKQIELQKPGAQEVKTIFYTFLHDF